MPALSSSLSSKYIALNSTQKEHRRARPISWANAIVHTEEAALAGVDAQMQARKDEARGGGLVAQSIASQQVVSRST